MGAGDASDMMICIKIWSGAETQVSECSFIVDELLALSWRDVTRQVCALVLMYDRILTYWSMKQRRRHDTVS